jgi:tetratricopeptide (TPR) repeat protein
MREPLEPMAAYAVDVRDGERWWGHPTQPHGWFSLTHIAYRTAMLPPGGRLFFLETLPESVLPDPALRPTQIEHGVERSTNPYAVAAEQFRVAAEDMERDSCFEMAYTTVASAARLVARHDAAGAMSATNHLARILRQLRQSAEAEALYTSNVTDGVRRGFPSVAGYAFTGLGNLAVMRGNRPAQLRYYTEALALAPVGSALETAARWGLMNHALAVNSLSDALEHGWRAFDLTTSDEERAGILSNLASVAFRSHFVDEAIAGYESAMRMARTARSWLGIAASAAEAVGAGGRESLLQYIESEGKRHGAAAVPFEQSRWLLGLARGWTAADEREAADRFARAARDLALQHEFHEVAYKADELLDELAAQEARRERSTPVPNWESLAEETRSGLSRLCTVGA